jgi:hypothetical protein
MRLRKPEGAGRSNRGRFDPRVPLLRAGRRCRGRNSKGGRCADGNGFGRDRRCSRSVSGELCRRPQARERRSRLALVERDIRSR